MNQQEKLISGGQNGEDLSVAELNLGKALALIHHVLPKIDEPSHAVRVQIALSKAVSFLEIARDAHAQETGVVVDRQTRSSVDSETVAAIAAAIAVLIGRPYRLVAVQPLPAPQLNVWALEGRTQIFMSHRVR